MQLEGSVITEEKKELATGIYQILKVETMYDSAGDFDDNDGKGKYKWRLKEDACEKEINGVRMAKWKKHDKSWLHVTSIPAEINLGQPITAVYKVTTGEDVGSSIDTSLSGDFKLNITNETSPQGTLRIKATLTNGEGSITVTPTITGHYKLANNALRQTQMNGTIEFDVLDV